MRRIAALLDERHRGAVRRAASSQITTGGPLRSVRSARDREIRADRLHRLAVEANRRVARRRMRAEQSTDG